LTAFPGVVIEEMESIIALLFGRAAEGPAERPAKTAPENTGERPRTEPVLDYYALLKNLQSRLAQLTNEATEVREALERMSVLDPRWDDYKSNYVRLCRLIAECKHENDMLRERDANTRAYVGYRVGSDSSSWWGLGWLW
jgi:hypothetical protein